MSNLPALLLPNWGKGKQIGLGLASIASGAYADPSVVVVSGHRAVIRLHASGEVLQRFAPPTARWLIDPVNSMGIASYVPELSPLNVPGVRGDCLWPGYEDELLRFDLENETVLIEKGADKVASVFPGRQALSGYTIGPVHCSWLLFELILRTGSQTFVRRTARPSKHTVTGTWLHWDPVSRSILAAVPEGIIRLPVDPLLGGFFPTDYRDALEVLGLEEGIPQIARGVPDVTIGDWKMLEGDEEFIAITGDHKDDWVMRDSRIRSLAHGPDDDPD